MAHLNLDRRITILRRTSTVNTFNESDDTWTTLTTVWASDVSTFGVAGAGLALACGCD